ncbi:hypothetical protein BDQ12DRAFT_105831 [Crucibulum laeve]|uniref:Transmembrane protein n=1 Tax=Crucibulum laeve TaxID=68775 RepID=A0A5C3LEV8_9AGAR|nr:hypothetical protein BDQ12DRAFT_105831 [Crucibulum laeve]
MSVGPAPRKVVVDDTDRNINYVGDGWFQDHGSTDSSGNFGPTYQHTLHGTKSNASLSYSFSGSDIHVYGTTTIRNNSGVLDPWFECFIDGIRINNSSFGAVENNWVLCQAPKPFTDGKHELTVNITSAGTTFWLDDIQYVPSPDVPLDTATILIDDSDPAIAYDDQWQALGGSSRMTTKTGGSMTFNFIGKSISWFAFIPTELSHTASSATYSIDGGPPSTFILNGLPAQSTITIYNQIFFTSPDLTPGPHNITVTNRGNGSTTPLAIDYLLVTNASMSDTSNHDPSSTGSDPSQSSTAQSDSGPPIGAIVGGVVGGLVLIAILLGLLFFWKRRQRQDDDLTDRHAEQVQPFNPGGAILELFYVSPQQTTQVSPMRQAPLVLRSAHASQPSFGESSTGFTSSDFTSSTPPALYHQYGGTRKHDPPPPVPPLSRISSSTANVVQHHDSGVRLPPNEDAVDVPPHYTVS